MSEDRRELNELQRAVGILSGQVTTSDAAAAEFRRTATTMWATVRQEIHQGFTELRVVVDQHAASVRDDLAAHVRDDLRQFTELTTFRDEEIGARKSRSRRLKEVAFLATILGAFVAAGGLIGKLYVWFLRLIGVAPS